MKTNKLFNILSAAVLVLGFSACVKEAPKYEPAEKPTTAEVYFSSELPSSYQVSNFPAFFIVPVNRANTAADFTASIAATADAAFSVPTSVNFSAGLTSASLRIAFDPSKLEDGKEYKFELKAASEASQYGQSAYSFTVKYTAPSEGGSDWQPFMTTTPVFVENIMKIYSSGIDTHTFDCYVEKFKDKEIYRIVNPMSAVVYNGKKYANPYYDETSSANGIWPEEFLNDDDYYIYLDMDGVLYAAECGGAELLPGEVYIAQSNLNFQWEDDGPFNIVSCANWPDCIDYGVGELLGKYDSAKKCITFNDYLFCAGNAIYAWPTYAGVPTSYLYFDKSLMKENYNEYDTEDWASGVAYSTLFGSVDKPLDFRTDVKFWMDEAKEGTDCIYYLPEYFDEDHGLAFAAPSPDALKDGDEITDVANEQEIGNIFGTDLYTNVKKGKVTIDENGFPTFEIQIDVYAIQDGKRVLDYGKFTETIVVDSFVEKYTDEDIIPAEDKADFLGTYSYKSNDQYNAGGAVVESIVPIVIEDAGKDETGDWVAISGLTGSGEIDTIYGYYEEGVVYIPSQDLDEPIMGYDFTFAPIDPKSFMYDKREELALGFVPNGKLAIVNTPGSTYSGAYFFCALGGLSLQWNYILESSAEPAMDSVAAPANALKLHELVKPVSKRSLNLNSGAKHVENGKSNSVQPISVR